MNTEKYEWEINLGFLDGNFVSNEVQDNEGDPLDLSKDDDGSLWISSYVSKRMRNE